MRALEMLRDLLGKFPFKSLFVSQLYVSGDRFHYFPSSFWLKLLSSQVYTRSVSRVRFSCFPVILNQELKSITHDFSVQPVYSHCRQEKPTVLLTGFLRILYLLGDVMSYLGKMCFYHSGGNPADQWLVGSSDFFMSRLCITCDSPLLLLRFSCLVSLPNPFDLAHQASSP